MNDAIQFHSCVGDDGILNLQVNLGQTEAKKEVVVTVEVAASPSAAAAQNWEFCTNVSIFRGARIL